MIKEYKDGRVKRTGTDMADLRRAVFDRAGGEGKDAAPCELCGRMVPWEGHVFQRGHLMHVLARKMGSGWRDDVLGNVVWACPIHNRDVRLQALSKKWASASCPVCRGRKQPGQSFCQGCREVLSPQVQRDLELCIGADYAKAYYLALQQFLSEPRPRGMKPEARHV